jgi:predicted PurR-regulated permease PerM
MSELQTTLFIGVIIGMVVMVIVRPAADWLTRVIDNAWHNRHKRT